MSNSRSPSNLSNRMNDEIVTLNKGSTEYEDSPEQIFLDLISKFKFTEGYAKARIGDQFVEERNVGCLVALDLCDRLCTLARMVISYSHVFTVWKKYVSQKPRTAIKSIDKWLTYRVTIGYAVIDQGKRFSPKDMKDEALSENMINDHMMGYTGCSLDDFDKKGERRSSKFKIRSRYSEKALKFFKQSKFQTGLLQPIRDYIKIVHDEYMGKLRVWGWKLDDLLTLKDMAFTSDIESLPPQFLISHWGMLYNNGDQWDRDSIKNVLHALKQLDAPRVIPPGQKAQSEKPSSNQRPQLQSVPLNVQGSFHPSTSVQSTKTKIPENPQEAFKFLYGDVLLSDLPPQALIFFSGKGESEIRQSKAILTYKEIKKSLATGELSHPDNYPRQDNDMSEDNDSDESVGKTHKKKISKRYIMSTSEGQFIINLPSCVGVHLGFYAPCYDDEWCWCPFSKISNNKWHEVVGIDSKLEPILCSSSKKFGPSDLVSHIQKKHDNFMGHGVLRYLNILFEDAFGDGESK